METEWKAGHASDMSLYCENVWSQRASSLGSHLHTGTFSCDFWSLHPPCAFIDRQHTSKSDSWGLHIACCNIFRKSISAIGRTLIPCEWMVRSCRDRRWCGGTHTHTHSVSCVALSIAAPLIQYNMSAKCRVPWKRQHFSSLMCQQQGHGCRASFLGKRIQIKTFLTANGNNSI